MAMLFAGLAKRHLFARDKRSSVGLCHHGGKPQAATVATRGFCIGGGAVFRCVLSQNSGVGEFVLAACFLCCVFGSSSAGQILHSQAAWREAPAQATCRSSITSVCRAVL